MVNTFTAALAAAGISLAAAQGGRLVESEVWTGMGASGATFTGYIYDGSGRLVKKEIRNSSDGTGPVTSHVEYAYDGQSRLREESGYLGSQRASQILYAYGPGGGLSRISTLGADGREKFLDSLLYSEDDRVGEKRRYRSGVLFFYRRYDYGSGGAPAADTLYEKSGEVFLATQAELTGYDDGGKAVSLTSRRVSAGKWFSISTVVTAYAGALAISQQEFEGDGEAGRSLGKKIFTHDSEGNRIKQESFDGAGKLQFTVAYAWSGPVASAFPRSGRPGQNAFTLDRLGPGMLRVGTAPGGPFSFRLLDAGGKPASPVLKGMGGGQFAVSTGKMTAGNYLAVFARNGSILTRTLSIRP